MKKHSVHTILFLLLAAFACLGLPLEAQGQHVRRSTLAAAGGGRLVIWRVATLGNDLIVEVKIDGRHVTDLTYGKHLDTALSPGRHTVTVKAFPRVHLASIDSVVIDVRPGELYNFTAKGSVTQLYLKRS
jgi:hypothetical protein